MFALAALICFVLALFGVSLGSINLMLLGLAFVALHLLWDIAIPVRGYVGRRRVD